MGAADLFLVCCRRTVVALVWQRLCRRGEMTATARGLSINVHECCSSFALKRQAPTLCGTSPEIAAAIASPC